MLIVAEILTDQARCNGNRSICHGSLKLLDGIFLLLLDLRTSLVDNGICLSLSLSGDLLFESVAGELGIVEDLLSLGFCTLELLTILSQKSFAFLSCLFRLLQRVLDRFLTLVQHALEQRPTKLGKNDPQDDEGDEHGDEFFHLRKNCIDSCSFVSERAYRECRRRSRKGDHATCAVTYVCVQFACLLLFFRFLR